jgi:hypothetical protein
LIGCPTDLPIPVITSSRLSLATFSDCARKPSKIWNYNSIRKFNLINIPLEKNNDKPKHVKPLQNVMLLNARSLFDKIDELEILVGNSDIDIVCITETWFKETVQTKLYLVPELHWLGMIERMVQEGELLYMLILKYHLKFTRT